MCSAGHSQALTAPLLYTPCLLSHYQPLCMAENKKKKEEKGIQIFLLTVDNPALSAWRLSGKVGLCCVSLLYQCLFSPPLAYQWHRGCLTSLLQQKKVN